MRAAEESISWSEIVWVVASQTDAGDAVESLVVENIVIVDDWAEEEVKDKIIAHIEVCFNVAHIIQGFCDVKPN